MLKEQFVRERNLPLCGLIERATMCKNNKIEIIIFYYYYYYFIIRYYTF